MTTKLLLMDANVLIDYRDSDLEVLALVGQHVGPVHVLTDDPRGGGPRRRGGGLCQAGIERHRAGTRAAHTRRGNPRATLVRRSPVPDRRIGRRLCMHDERSGAAVRVRCRAGGDHLGPGAHDEARRVEDSIRGGGARRRREDPRGEPPAHHREPDRQVQEEGHGRRTTSTVN